MIMLELVRMAHVLGAMVLFGTGIGIAFFMLMAHRTGRAEMVAHVTRTVVIADTLFTATAFVIQPVTGIVLARMLNWPLTEGWLMLSLMLYAVVGAFWLPVVWLQLRMRRLAEAAVVSGRPLPPSYHRLFRIWFISGWPAFAAMLGIVWLMVSRPRIELF